jgi:hypothetical protein
MSNGNIFVDTERGLVTDVDGNIAYVDHFYGLADFNEDKALEFAKDSLDSLMYCRGCINSSDLICQDDIVENTTVNAVKLN